MPYIIIYTVSLMGKSKIQPLVPFISRRGQILIFLLLRHLRPFCLPYPISPNIVSLDCDDENKIPG